MNTLTVEQWEQEHERRAKILHALPGGIVRERAILDGLLARLDDRLLADQLSDAANELMLAAVETAHGAQ